MVKDTSHIDVLSDKEFRDAGDRQFDSQNNTLVPNEADLMSRGAKIQDALRNEQIAHNNQSFLRVGGDDPALMKREKEKAEQQHYAIIQQKDEKYAREAAYKESVDYFEKRIELDPVSLFAGTSWEPDLESAINLGVGYIAREAAHITPERHLLVSKVSLSMFVEARGDTNKMKDVMANHGTKALFFIGESHYTDLLASDPNLANMSQENKMTFKNELMTKLIEKYNDSPEAFAAQTEIYRSHMKLDSAQAGRHSQLTDAEMDRYLETYHSFNEYVIEKGYDRSDLPENATPAQERIEFAGQKAELLQKYRQENPEAYGLDRMERFVSKESAQASSELYAYATEGWTQELVASTIKNINPGEILASADAGEEVDPEKVALAQDIKNAVALKSMPTPLVNKILDSLPEDQRPSAAERKEYIHRMRTEPDYHDEQLALYADDFGVAEKNTLDKIAETSQLRTDISANVEMFSKLPKDKVQEFLAKDRSKITNVDIKELSSHISDEEFEQRFGMTKNSYMIELEFDDVRREAVVDQIFVTKQEYDDLKVSDPKIYSELEAQRDAAMQDRTDKESKELDKTPELDMSKITTRSIRGDKLKAKGEIKYEINRAVAADVESSKELSPQAQIALKNFNESLPEEKKMPIIQKLEVKPDEVAKNETKPEPDIASSKGPKKTESSKPTQVTPPAQPKTSEGVAYTYDSKPQAGEVKFAEATDLDGLVTAKAIKNIDISITRGVRILDDTLNSDYRAELENRIDQDASMQMIAQHPEMLAAITERMKDQDPNSDITLSAEEIEAFREVATNSANKLIAEQKASEEIKYAVTDEKAKTEQAASTGIDETVKAKEAEEAIPAIKNPDERDPDAPSGLVAAMENSEAADVAAQEAQEASPEAPESAIQDVASLDLPKPPVVPTAQTAAEKPSPAL